MMKKYLFPLIFTSFFLGCYEDTDDLAFNPFEEGGEPLITISSGEVSGTNDFRRVDFFINSGYYGDFSDEMRDLFSRYQVYTNGELSGGRAFHQTKIVQTGESGDKICIEATFLFKTGEETKKSEPHCITL